MQQVPTRTGPVLKRNTMIKYGCLFFSLLLSVGTLSAQRNPPARVNQRWLERQDTTAQGALLEDQYPVSANMDNGFGLHFMPFGLINVLPRLRLGAQLKHHRLSYLLDLEYATSGSAQLPNDRGNRDYRFYGLRPEVRYDIGRYRDGWYVGLELPVTYFHRNITENFTDVEGNRRSVDRARQERRRFSATGKFGIQRLLGEHFLLDAYTGLGVAYRDVRYTERVGDSAVPEENFEEWGFFGPSREGKFWMPELALGIRVGYWF